MEVDETGFTRLVAVDEVAVGQMVQIAFEDDFMEVAVANVDGTFYAFRDVCPHMMFPLSVGQVEGSTLECAGHGWRFNIKTGKAIYPPIRKGLTLYEVEIRAGEVWAKITLLQ